MMNRTSFASACLVALAALAGCKDSPKTAPAPESTPSAAVASDDARLRDRKVLALADSRGTTALDQSILALRQVAEKNPKKVDSWVLLGRQWISKARTTSDPGFYTNADACADVALALDPKDKLARGLKGLVALNGHRFADAKEIAQKILAEYPDDPMSLGTLSDANLELGAIDEAASAAQRMVTIKPNLPSYGRIGHLAWIHGKTDAAKDAARLAIDAGRDVHDLEPWAWQVTATAMYFWHEGDYEGAEAGCDKALALFPEYPPALAAKGRAALSRGDAKRAVDLLARSLKARPLVETAWLLADAEDAAGDAAKARATRELAEKEGKRSDPLTLSLLYSTRNEHADEALTLAQEEMKTRPGIPAHDALAWALYRKGSFADAKVAIAAARKWGTKDARLLYHEGAIAIATGDTKGGRALVEQALKTNPRFDATAAPEAKALLGTSGAAFWGRQ